MFYITYRLYVRVSRKFWFPRVACTPSLRAAATALPGNRQKCKRYVTIGELF